jgi:hypothetical protein
MEIIYFAWLLLAVLCVVGLCAEQIGAYFVKRQQKHDLHTQIQQRNFLLNLVQSLKNDVPNVWK